jgi:hypothetical protein
MEDIVGIKIKDKKCGEGAFITWGRLFHVIDDKELLEVIKKHMGRWGITELESIELCYSLMEIAHMPYFYECLIRFIQEPIPYGPKYEAWKKKKIKALKDGHDIYFTGFMKNYLDYLERKKLGFSEE